MGGFAGPLVGHHEVGFDYPGVNPIWHIGIGPEIWVVTADDAIAGA